MSRNLCDAKSGKGGKKLRKMETEDVEPTTQSWKYWKNAGVSEHKKKMLEVKLR